MAKSQIANCFCVYTAVKDSASRLTVVVNIKILFLVYAHCPLAARIAILYKLYKTGTRGEVKMKWCSMIRGWT